MSPQQSCRMKDEGCKGVAYLNATHHDDDGGSMHVKFWGTRGSIPKPGVTTIRYGGNTSCVELCSSAGTYIIIDCGTGGHALGLKLLSSGVPNNHGHMLISHTHWDHIQGIPFFAPFFVQNEAWDVYGPLGLNQSIQEILAGQMQHTYFPVTINQFGPKVRYHNLIEGSFEIGDVKISTHYLNHPVLACGYRLEVDGVVIVYACDHEPHSHMQALTQAHLNRQDLQHSEFLEGADLVMHDAQYTLAEYANKIGWGHSPIEYAVKVCQQAGVKKLALTHHDPLRDDDSIDKIVQNLSQQLTKEGSSLKIFAAAEGQELDLCAPTIKTGKSSAKPLSASILVNPIICEQSVFICVSDTCTSDILSEALSIKGINTKFISEPKELNKQILENKPSLVLIEHNPPVINGLKICQTISKELIKINHSLPIVLIANEEYGIQSKENYVTDWLITPFTSSYARSKIFAWILRTACRWLKAPIPENEKQRLAALHRLMLLDTKADERFDRITRIVAALLHVPVAMISLVDANRQWFKSCYGFDVKESSRESSFCGHVVYGRETMVIPDTFLDNRFADNPLVVDEPRIRFYAGSPLILEDGSCIGTLCCFDTRPRVLSDKDIKLLNDLRDMTLKEINNHKPH